jgi:peptide deformylase
MSDIFKINTDDLGHTKITPEVGVFELVADNDPILKETMPIFKFDGSVDANSLASRLVETAKKYNGIGLSANQCGQRHRVFVMGAGDEYVAFFNPKVLETKGESHMLEGCLSFPLLGLRITRPAEILVEYQDYHGQTHQMRFNGISARCFLHELDHLSGICYTDIVKPLALKSGLDKRDKAIKKIATQQAYMMKAKKHGERQSKAN